MPTGAQIAGAVYFGEVQKAHVGNANEGELATFVFSPWL